jgi:3-methylfumaryl-CoA hydratase
VTAGDPILVLADAGFEPEAQSPISTEHAVRIAATIDADPSMLVDGRLPSLWHWCYFTPAVRTGKLGPDGHPVRQPQLAGYPRRLWGASRVTHHQRLQLDKPATRHSQLVEAQKKSGSTGEFWVMTVRHHLEQGGTLCIEEDQDIVLRAPTTLPGAGHDRHNAPEDEWVEECQVDERLLFRYSALTFNTHRIHYDRRYTADVEGYPDLVVHGPLLATLLVDFLRRRTNHQARIVEFRAQAPTYVQRRFWLVGHPQDTGYVLRVLRGDHEIAVALRAELEA